MAAVSLSCEITKVFHNDCEIVKARSSIISILISLVEKIVGMISLRPDREFWPARNRNQVAMILPEPEPDRHPKKVAGFDQLAGSCRIS